MYILGFYINFNNLYQIFRDIMPANLGVSRNKAVQVVVDLLKYKASVHEGEAALCGKRNKYNERRFIKKKVHLVFWSWINLSFQSFINNK